LLIVAARRRTEGRVTEDCPLLLDVTTGTPSYYATLRTLVRTAESWPIAGPRPRPRTNTAQPPASCIDRSVQPSTPYHPKRPLACVVAVLWQHLRIDHAEVATVL